MRLPIVAVIGSGKIEHAGRAEPLGRMLAHRGVHLLTGGGRGVMTAVTRAFTAVHPRKGLAIGVVPSAENGGPDAAEGYPNEWVEIPIRTHLPLSGARGSGPMSRNHMIALTPDAMVALPGTEGTRSEIELSRRYGRPLAAFLDRREEFPGLPDWVHMESSLDGIARFLTEAGVPERA